MLLPFPGCRRFSPSGTGVEYRKCFGPAAFGCPGACPPTGLRPGPFAQGARERATPCLQPDAATALAAPAAPTLIARVANLQPLSILVPAHQLAAVAHEIRHRPRQVPRLLRDGRKLLFFLRVRPASLDPTNGVTLPARRLLRSRKNPTGARTGLCQKPDVSCVASDKRTTEERQRLALPIRT